MKTIKRLFVLRTLFFLWQLLHKIREHLKTHSVFFCCFYIPINEFLNLMKFYGFFFCFCIQNMLKHLIYCCNKHWNGVFFVVDKQEKWKERSIQFCFFPHFFVIRFKHRNILSMFDWDHIQHKIEAETFRLWMVADDFDLSLVFVVIALQLIYPSYKTVMYALDSPDKMLIQAKRPSSYGFFYGSFHGESICRGSRNSSGTPNTGISFSFRPCASHCAVGVRVSIWIACCMGCRRAVEQRHGRVYGFSVMLVYWTLCHICRRRICWVFWWASISVCLSRRWLGSWYIESNTFRRYFWWVWMLLVVWHPGQVSQLAMRLVAAAAAVVGAIVVAVATVAAFDSMLPFAIEHIARWCVGVDVRSIHPEWQIVTSIFRIDVVLVVWLALFVVHVCWCASEDSIYVKMTFCTTNIRTAVHPYARWHASSNRLDDQSSCCTERKCMVCRLHGIA